MSSIRDDQNNRGAYHQKSGKQGLQLIGLIGLLGALVVNLSPALAQSTSLTLARNFRPDPVKLTGSTGGSISLGKLASGEANCRGFANNLPNHTVKLTENFPVFDFLIYTNNINDDPTLLIKGSNGITICADDESKGRNPQVSKRLPEGTYQIWVGSSDANKSIGYTLSLSEIRQK